MSKRIGLIFTLTAALGFAQQGQVAGPVVGYAFDGTAHAVRPVLGIPGASIFGNALPFGYDVASAWISPAGDSIVAAAANGSLHFLQLSGGQATEIPLNGASLQPDRAVFSPSGSAVALVAGGRAQVFGGLPASPTLVTTFDLGSATASGVSAQAIQRPAAVLGSVAVSDDGTLLLFVANGAVHLAGAGGPRSFEIAGRETAVAFAPASHDAVLATKYGATVLHGIDTAGTQQALTPENPLDNIAGAAFSADGKSLFVAGGQSVIAFDLSSGSPTAIACSSAPTRLERMTGVYRLNDAGTGPLWLLDPAAGHQRVVFVPAAGGSE